jgi:chloramphenicol-sensitive protein RarD
VQRPLAAFDRAAAQAARQGVIFGILAYGLWGLVPLYFQLVQHVRPEEVLAQRVLWSLVLLAGLVTLRGRWGEVRPALAARKTLLMLSASTLLLAINWFTYIYAVASQQVVEASLGYFLNPLVNVVLGVWLLGEKLRRWQTVSLGLAIAGVAILGAPLIAVLLATSFAFYGLLRKQVAVDGLLGLLVETALLAPLGLAYVAWLQVRGESAFVLADPATCLKLMASSVVTAAPLLLFTAAARRLRFSTLGFLQYLSPTLQFLLAVFVFGEELTTIKLTALGFIWAAVGIYSVDALRTYRHQRFAAYRAMPADV